MKMLSFMRSHNIKEWNLVHVLLGVIIFLTCIASGLLSFLGAFSFFIGGESLMCFGISLAIFTVSLTFFIYVEEGKRE